MTREEAEVILKVNDEQSKKKFEGLEAKARELKKQFEEAFQKGDTTGIVKINKELQKVNKQMDGMRTNAANIRAAMVRLDEASPKELQKTIKYINSELNSGRVKRGSDEWKYYIERLKETQAELQKVKAEMALSDDRGLMSKMKDGFNEWAAAGAAAIAAFAGVVMSGKSAVQAYADMQAEEANVRKFTGMTADEVSRLNEEFKKMDTRTSREDLNKLAQEAGRLGKQSIEDVLGFVKAADQLNVALDDLGDGATLTLSKLTGIFGDEKIYGTEKSLLKVGSVINELSQNCSASAPYLAEFSSRLGGIAAQSKMTISQTMAFAAVLDTQNMALEASATAVGQLITKIYKEPEKFAKASGLEVKKFTDMVKTDMNGALIMLFEHLNKFGGMETLAKVFDDMGTDGARAVPVLAALAGHVDELKEQQQAANQAFREGISVTNEFNVQNNTVQAGLDKAKKRFNEIAVTLGEKLLPVMRYCISGSSMMLRVLSVVVDFIIKNKTEIIILTSAVIAYYTALNAAVIKLKLVDSWMKAVAISAKAFSGVEKIFTLAVTGMRNTVEFFTNGLQVNYAMQQRWRKSLSAMKWTNWTGLVLAAVAALGIFLSKLRKTVSIHDELAKIQEKASRNAAEEANRLRLLETVANDENAALKERKSAIEELNNIIPDYNGLLDETSGKYSANKKALDEYIESLLRFYEIEGAKDTLAELGKEKAALNIERKKHEKELSREQVINAVQYHNNSPVTTQGAVVPAGVLARIGASGRIQSLKNDLKNIEKELDRIAEKEKAIIDIYGADSLKPNSNSQHKSNIQHPSSITLPESDDARKKREEAQRKALKEALDNQKYLRDKAEADNLKAYAIGAKNYAEYADEKERIELDYADKVVKIHEDHNKIDIAAYGSALLKQVELKEKSVERIRKLSVEKLDKQFNKDQHDAFSDYYDPNGALFNNQKALNQRLFELEIKLLQDKAKLYKKGSKEREKLEKEADDSIAKDQLEKLNELAEAYQRFRNDTSRDAVRERLAYELAMHKKLLDAELITVKQYEEAVLRTKKKYSKELYGEALGMLDQSITSALSKLGLAGELLEAGWRRRIEGMSEENKERFNKSMDGNPFYQMFNEGIEAAGTFYETLSNISSLSLEDLLKNIADIAENSAAIIGAVNQTFSQYWNAQRDLEISQIEKRYQTEIDAAKNNSKKVAKLEAQKDAEIAKVKNRYNDRAMRMEIAMATAQTAVAAINAYASASKDNWILGPIAAAMATAAGAIQIATIKKQHEAEAAGYYSGGFTAKDPDNRREVGVVHANEFVANHQAVANPSLSPLFRIIDHAQRNNTVGTLSAEDVDIALGRRIGVSARGGVSDSSTASAEAFAMAAAAVSQSNAATRQAVDRLTEILKDGVEAKMIMDGEDGFHRKYEHFKRLKSNPER